MLFTKQDLKKLKFKFDKDGNAKRNSSNPKSTVYWSVVGEQLTPLNIGDAIFTLYKKVNIKDEYLDDLLGRLTLSFECAVAFINFSEFNSLEEAETFFSKIK